MDYVTLLQLRAELGLGADETSDDDLLRRILRRGRIWIDGYTGRHFDPRRAIRRQAGGYPDILLDDELLEVLALANGDGTVIDPATLLFRPANATPYWAVYQSDLSPWLASLAGIYPQALPLDGVWGYHTHYADAWPRTLDAVADAPLLSTATVITVADADGVAEDSDEPRFQVGNLIRLGPAGLAAEYALVRAVDADSAPNTITVQRGVNGTTAAQWPVTTPLYVFRPEAQWALVRLATWAYRLKDVTFFERITILGSTQKVAPGGIPDDVLELLPPPGLVIRG